MTVWQISSAALAILLLSMAMFVAQAAGISSSNDIGSWGNSGAKAEVDLVAEACKNLLNSLLSNKVHFDEEPCVSVLRSDKRSAVAKDHSDLVVIALDLLERRSNKVAAKIDNILQRLTVHNRTQRAFQFCSANYAGIVRTLPACRDMFLELKPLGKKAPCFDLVGDDVVDTLGCLDSLDPKARDSAVLLRNNWQGTDIEEFEDVVRLISLAW
ncbi:hypothetical protein ACP4OV_023780 [Aristida adscensionis]